MSLKNLGTGANVTPIRKRCKCTPVTNMDIRSHYPKSSKTGTTTAHKLKISSSGNTGTHTGSHLATPNTSLKGPGPAKFNPNIESQSTQIQGDKTTNLNKGDFLAPPPQRTHKP